MPLGFEANRGQSDPAVRYLARGEGYGVFLTRRDVVLALGAPREASVVRMTPVGASQNARLTPSGRLPRRVNYFVGRTSTRVPSYRRVTYDGVYPGIDLVLRGNQRALEYDFVVRPGAKSERIALRFRGARAPSLAADGALLLRTRTGEVRQAPPYVYQLIDGRRRSVPGRFTLRRGLVGFDVGRYDRGRPLVIDPVIDYSTFLGGGSSYDMANALAVDADGSAYVAGLTFSADYPATAGAADRVGPGVRVCAPADNPGFQPAPADDCRSDAFVTKLDPQGSDVVYSTFIGGSASDRVQDIAVDPSGAAYVTGGTDSADFPTTAGAVDRAAAGERRVMGVGLLMLGESFLTKLSPDGARLEYSTFLGGADAEEGMGVAVGRGGGAYVTGHTFSPDYPTTPGAFDRGLNTPAAPPNVCSDAFLTKVSPKGDRLRHSTFLGGSRLEFSWGLGIDDRGAAYVLGETMSRDAPVTPGAFQPEGHVHSGPENDDCATPLDHFDDADLLVMKVAPDGSRLAYSTYLGGRFHEHGLGIAVRDRRAYVTGHTDSADFPTTPGTFDERKADGRSDSHDGFVAKLSRGGDTLEYSTRLGGAGSDWAFGIDVDSSGAAFLTGWTYSSDFPVTPDALDRSYAPPEADAFLTRLAPDGSDLLYSSYLGGSGPDVGLAVVATHPGSAYVSGITYSPDMPTTPGAIGRAFGGPIGYSDGFVARFSGFPPVARTENPRPTRLRIAVRPAVVRAGERTRLRFRVTAGGAPVPGAVVRVRGRRVRTGAQGRAAARIRFRFPGRKTVRADKRGHARGRAVVRVLQARRARGG